MSVIEKFEVHKKTVALRSPFKTALREVSEFEVVQVVINGSGIGEAVGVPAVTGESSDQIAQDLLSLSLLQSDITDRSLFFKEIIAPLHISLGAKAAIDMAVLDLTPPQSLSIKSDVTIPIASRDELPTLIKEREEFPSLKIKFKSEALSELIAKMELVRELAPQSSLRVDPNQSWDRELAARFLKEIEKRGIKIDYLEQPCEKSDFDSFKELKAESSIELMADESCFSQDNLLRLIDGGAIDYVNLKILKHGGITPTFELAKLAQSAGIKISIGSMMESERGVRYAAYIASVLEPDLTHDLDAAWWLRDTSLRYEKGVLFA